MKKLVNVSSGFNSSNFSDNEVEKVYRKSNNNSKRKQKKMKW